MRYNYKEVEGGTETPLERLKNKLSGIFLCFDILSATNFSAADKQRHLSNCKGEVENIKDLLMDLENICEEC